MSYIDWNPSDDPLLRETEVELHEQLHAVRADNGPNLAKILSSPRLYAFPRAEKITGQRITGRVLDIGCGSGYASAWLALNRPVQVVYAMESTRAAVESLIPKTLSLLGVPVGKVKPTLGSFNRIPLESFFDVIVAFGAIHHSTNLLNTLTECAKALKPGGILIAQEPASEDGATNEEFLARYAAEEHFHGQTIQIGSRDDRFFRQCEYKAATVHAGLDIVHFRRFWPAGHPIQVLRALRMDRLRTVRARRHAGKTGDATLKPPKSYLLIARKPASPLAYVPHRWC